jgi:probable rRNA maturation factor
MLHPLRLSLQFARLAAPDPHRAALPRHRVARWIRHALARNAEITVRIVDQAEGLALNRSYRKQDHATNVLTFDYSREPVVCADLVLCAPVVAREALEQGKTLQAHYTHLIVHGILHAQGWDHMKAARSPGHGSTGGSDIGGLRVRNPYQAGLPGLR